MVVFFIHGFKKAAFNVDQGDVIDDGSEQEVDSKVNNDDNFNFSRNK